MIAFVVKKLGSAGYIIEMDEDDTFNDLAVKIVETYQTDDLCLHMNYNCVSYELDYNTSLKNVAEKYGNTIFCLYTPFSQKNKKIGSLGYLSNQKENDAFGFSLN
jgi:hypothetical protein